MKGLGLLEEPLLINECKHSVSFMELQKVFPLIFQKSLTFQKFVVKNWRIYKLLLAKVLCAPINCKTTSASCWCISVAFASYVLQNFIRLPSEKKQKTKWNKNHLIWNKGWTKIRVTILSCLLEELTKRLKKAHITRQRRRTDRTIK